MNEQLTPSLLVVVPRAEVEACRRLQTTLAGPGVRVVLDRRDGRRDAPRPAPADERRARAERDAALAAGRWIVVAGGGEPIDVLDVDARAIMFLYCSQHLVPCERCQDTYRLGWLARTDSALSCPRCHDDLTSIVTAHALQCENWTHRRTGGAKPRARVAGLVSPRRAAAG
jgi:hypothetical protein